MMPTREHEHALPESVEGRRKLAEQLASDNCGASFDDAMRLLTTLADDRRPDVRFLAVQSLRSRCARAELDESEVEAIVYPIVSRGFEHAASEMQSACLSLLKAAQVDRQIWCSDNQRAPTADVKWAVPYLIAFIDHGEERLRSEAVDLFWTLSREDLQTRETCLQSGTHPINSLTAQIRLLFSDFFSSPEELVVIRDFLRHRDPHLRRLGLVAASWKGREHLAETSMLLDDAVLEVRLAAVAALERIGPDGLTALARFAGGLARPSAEDAEGDLSAPAGGILIGGEQTGVSEEIACVLSRTLGAIGRMGIAASTARPVVRDGLWSPDARVRVAAVEAWTRIAGSADEVLPDIIRRLGDPDERVVDAADSAIRWLIGGGARAAGPVDVKDAIQLLDNTIKGAASPSRLFHYLPLYVSTIMSSQELTDLLPRAMDSIALALSSADEIVRDLALYAIGDIGPQATRFAPSVAEIIAKTFSGELQTYFGTPSFCAWRALQNIGEGAAVVLPQIMDLLECPNAEIRWNAALTITHIDPDQRDALRLVEQMRDTPGSPHYQRAATRLRELAEAASESAGKI
jgi:HEAT repeat protein